MAARNTFLAAFYHDQTEGKADTPVRSAPINTSALATNRWVQPHGGQPVSWRTWCKLGVILVMMPLVIWWGWRIGDRQYLAVSLIMLVLALVPFFMVFEDRRPQTRELMVIAVLIALGVAGRGALFMFPQVKPVAAIVIISGISFGPETGFLVGAMTALVSNIFFTQGPWTPWQMFAFGMIGLAAGLFYRWGWLRTHRVALSTFGFMSIFCIYGLIMNPAALLMFTPTPTWKGLLAVYISGAPMDAVHAISTFMFLWVLARPMLTRLERVKVKYGLINRDA